MSNDTLNEERENAILEEAARILGAKDADTLRAVLDGAKSADFAVNLTVNYCYEGDDDKDPTPPLDPDDLKDMRRVLENGLRDAIGDGMLTGGRGDMLVDQYCLEVVPLR